MTSRAPRKSRRSTKAAPRRSAKAVESTDPTAAAPMLPTPAAINPRGSVPFLLSARGMWINPTGRTLRDVPLGDTVCRLWFPGDVKPVREALAADAVAAGLTRVE